MAKFENILETVGNTPVVRINRLGPKGINLFVKIEAFNPLGSVKDRLALGIIEAAEKSGTLITARMALDYNRDVLAVPGPINSDFSKGTNRLIRQGATPITSSEDILEALGFKTDTESKQKNLFEDANLEEKNVLKILREPLPRDELIRALGMPIQRANSLLSIMEIKGLIVEELGVVRVR